MGDRRSVDRGLVVGNEEKMNVQNLVIDGSLILKWIFKIWNGDMD